MDEHVEYAGERWRVLINAIRAPRGEAHTGFLACYLRADAAVPPAPIVGTWEVRLVHRNQRRCVQTFCSNEIYSLHELPYEVSGANRTWEGAEWVDRFVPLPDRASVYHELGTALFDNTHELHTHLVRIQSPRTGNIRTLHLGARSRQDPRTGLRVMTGLAVPTNDCASPRNPTIARVVDTHFRLSTDPMCVIDAHHEHLALTSNRFRELRLHRSRALANLCHHNDLPALRTYLQQTLTQPESAAVRSVTIRLRTKANVWLPIAIAAIPLAGAPRQLLCRAAPRTPDFRLGQAVDTA
ncbi:hypothetical protein [Sciscionella sediminilitoris]|uniref:hypothetical protein n=1 Tax=Sciscionella sediminilitoris TaxID=1445613 RepID=UPI0012E2EF5F|nr:hypothetical protein [Sciscionella sp. SE31]